jgi:hypothetical protein
MDSVYIFVILFINLSIFLIEMDPIFYEDLLFQEVLVKDHPL